MFTDFYCCFYARGICLFLIYPWTFHGVHATPNFLRYHLLGSFPVRGSFAVWCGDRFQFGAHLRACTVVSYKNKCTEHYYGSKSCYHWAASQIWKSYRLSFHLLYMFLEETEITELKGILFKLNSDWLCNQTGYWFKTLFSKNPHTFASLSLGFVSCFACLLCLSLCLFLGGLYCAFRRCLGGFFK